jgi:cysteine desulfurase family protein (TIGR01976 family)
VSSPTSERLDVAAVRARFSALDRPLAFFDAPGGTQCPDEVIDAIAAYLRESNANVDAPYETSQRTNALVARSRESAASFLGCSAAEVAFGPSMTALNFLLTRAFARTLRAGDEIVVTKLDHDANVAPWLELAHDLGVVVRHAGLTEELELDYEDLAAQLSERTRVVAFPVAANSVGTAPDVRRIVKLAHEAGALAWADAVHHAQHGPIDVHAWDVDVLICSPYKFYGPHLGLAFGKSDLIGSWRPYKVRPAANEPIGRRYELGTLQHELLAGFVAAVDYLDSLGWDAIRAHEHALGERFLAGLPEKVMLYGPPTMEGRVATFCFNLPGRTPEDVATRLAERDLAVWHGDYYALETMLHLGLEDGAVRAGIVHYNTEAEVDRLLAALAELV